MNILLIFIILVSVIRFEHSPLYINTEYILVDLSITAILVFIYIYVNKAKINNILLSHSSIFFLSYLIVYYQYDIDMILGNMQATNALAWQFEVGVCKSICLSNAALAAFTLALKQCLFKPSRKSFVIKSISQKLIVKIATLSQFLFIIFVDKAFLFGGYSVVSMGGIASQFEEMMQMSLIALFVIISYNIRREYQHNHSYLLYFYYFKTPLILTLVYIIMMSLAGARYAVLRMVLIAVISFLYSFRVKIPKFTIIIAFITASTLFSLQGLLRNGKSELTESVNVLSERKSISPMTSELAFSVTASHIALSEVPDSYQFNKGLTFLPYFLLLIPGMRGLFYSIFNIPPEMLSSSHFITFIGLGTLSNFGVGSSSIADIYISFGVIGVILIFYLFGYYLRKIEYSTFYDNLTSPYIIAFSYCIYSQMLYANRESILTVFTGVPYVLLFVYIAIKTSRAKSN